jgi:hypothetical protein
VTALWREDKKGKEPYDDSSFYNGAVDQGYKEAEEV